MLDENLLDGAAEMFDVFAQLGRNVDKVGVDVIGQRVGAAETDDRTSALRDLAEDDAEVGDRVLDGLLELAQVTAGVLQTCFEENRVPSDSKKNWQLNQNGSACVQ